MDAIDLERARDDEFRHLNEIAAGSMYIARRCRCAGSDSGARSDLFLVWEVYDCVDYARNINISYQIE